MNSLFQRVKQFLAALTARVTANDRQLVSQALSLEESQLFWAMNLPDQRHTLNVAYTAMKLARKWPTIDRQLLLRCALLHDVGKIKGDLSTYDKIITVLAHKASPRWARSWGRYGRGNKLANVRHAFYIYFHHSARSAAMLRELGLEQEAAIVAKHHEAPAGDEPLELVLLRQADELH